MPGPNWLAKVNGEGIGWTLHARHVGGSFLRARGGERGCQNYIPTMYIFFTLRLLVLPVAQFLQLGHLIYPRTTSL